MYRLWVVTPALGNILLVNCKNGILNCEPSLILIQMGAMGSSHHRLQSMLLLLVN